MYTYTYTAFIAFTFLMFPTGIPMHLTYQINAIHVCVYVCVCVCVCVFLHENMGIQTGQKDTWSYSYRQLGVNCCGCLEVNSHPPENHKCTYLMTHFSSNSISPKTLVFWFFFVLFCFFNSYMISFLSKLILSL
jgi:hypothetical protein